MLDFNNKTILITGGTGSFGRNFATHLLDNFNPRRLIIFSRDELKQFRMKEEIKDERIRFFLGDVRDAGRLERAFNGVDIIVHAAALKQVPMLEYNPFEAVKTNVLGSQNVIEAAINQKVSQVLLVSTDKAVQPVNLYGSTKLCAEKLFISGNSYSASGRTRFSCVRYGNVLGSRGSIVEALVKNKDNGAKVCITDERMTRFWITLKQSFELVLFALEYMVGGEIFVPKAPSMKLTDMFEAVAPQCEKTIIGIRPGEKLHEVLLTSEESRRSVDLGNFFVILPDHKEIFNIEERFAKFISQGRKCPEEFVFASELNNKWLTKEELLELIEDKK